MPRRLIARSGIWHYRRRVPGRFADVDPRQHVEISLETRDLSRAEKLKAEIERELEAYWLALKRGGSPDARERYLGALERVRLEGFEYRTNAELAADPGAYAELLARIERLEAIGGLAKTDQPLADALGGLVDRPELTLSKALEEFFALTRTEVRKKSPDQVRKWKNPRIKAIGTLIALVGDKPVTRITRADALALRSFWVERVDEEGYQPNSANKDFIHLAGVFDTLDRLLVLNLGKPFADLRLTEDKRARRSPFGAAEIARLLAPESLAGINDEAADILLVMVETGLRPVEICGLTAADIFVGEDEPIPHVRIRPRAEDKQEGTFGRELKTPFSERDMPLVGVSLLAMRRHPAGFPRYFDKSASWSAAINKVLRERGLLPSEKHSAYSLRHSFQDRLTQANMPDRIQTQLMGHKFDRPEYGAGASLEHKRDWLRRIAVTNEDGSPRSDGLVGQRPDAGEPALPIA